MLARSRYVPYAFKSPMYGLTKSPPATHSDYALKPVSEPQMRTVEIQHEIFGILRYNDLFIASAE